VTIENSGEAPDRLVGATSPIAGRVEIHEMRMDDGTMIMRAAESGVEIPAGGKATLAPGGLHIMFMELNEGLVEGNAIPVMLNFETAGDVEVLFPVEAIGARGPGGDHGHDTEMHGAYMHGEQMHDDHGNGDDPEGPRMNGHGQ
jgi:copper(I)-binding protein